MVKKNYFYFIFFYFLGITTYAQKVSTITYVQEQSNIIVSYDLETKTPCKIDLYVSTNGGTTWQGPLKKVTGDVGAKIANGSHSITWNVLEEFEELSGTNIKFQVRAEEAKTQSIASINKAIVKNPKDAKLFKLRGDLKLDLGDRDGAIADYTKAISLNPKYADAYKARGILMYLEDVKTAISDFTKAISLNLKDASSYYWRASSKNNLEDYKGEISDYTTALELEPNNIKFILARARAKASLKNYNGAIEDLNKIVELDSTYIIDTSDDTPNTTFKLRGFFKYSNKDFEGFDKDINHYVKYSTNPSNALLSIANSFFYRSEYNIAIDYFTKSIDLLPEILIDSLEEREGYLGRAFSKYLQKNEFGAKSDFNKYVEKSQDQAEANSNIAEGFGKGYFGKYFKMWTAFDDLDLNLKEVIYYLTKAIELDPKNDSYYYNRAAVKVELKDYRGAVEDFSKAIKIEPNNSSYYTESGANKVELKDYRGAIEDYSKAIELDPGPYDYVGRGNAKFNIQDYRGAITDFSKAILLEPNSEDYYLIRGNAKYNIGDYKGAIVDYTKVILLNPKNGEAYLSRGDSKILIKDKAGACKDFSKAGELGEDEAYKSINENCNK